MNRIIIAAAALAFLTGPSFAHASLKASAPADGASVQPTELELSFNEVLNLTFSGVKLVGPDQVTVETGKPAAIGDGTSMTVPVPTTLSPGAYTVEWNVLSADGHKLNGSYGFTVTP